MGESDGEKLSEHLTKLRDGLESQTKRTNALENTLAKVEDMIGQVEQKLNDQISSLSLNQQVQQEKMNETILKLDNKVQGLNQYISTQISELTTEIRSLFAVAPTRTSSPSPSTTPPVDNFTSPHPSLNLPSHDAILPSSLRQTIIIQPPTAAPSFSGSVYDKPRPFLLQLHQYTTSSYGWNKETLFQNIGQFLKGTALEWYTQISTSSSPPTHWDMFQTLFLQQFSSPLRLAQIEQEWKQCTQKSNESINEFLVRLRSLWSEHKPQEKERDLVRHLFAKIRPELVPLIGVLNNPTLENFLERARQAEVDGTLEGYPIRFTIDTGSNLTVLSEETFHQLSYESIPLTAIDSPPLIIRCANGQPLRTNGLYHLNISFQNKSFTHPVYVLPHLQHSCIVGLDFLRKHNMYVGGQHDQILFLSESEVTQSPTYHSPPPDQKKNTDPIPLNSSSYSLQAIDAHDLPPYHSMIIAVQPTKSFFEYSEHQTYFVSSIKESPLVANGLISPNKKLFIEVSNFSPHPINIQSKQKLAVMELISEHQLNILSKAKPMPQKTQEQNVCLPDLSQSDLNENEKAKLISLMSKYPNVFTEYPGRTHLTKHVIELQPGTKPCNTQPYRLAPSKKAIVDQQLEEMLQTKQITPSRSPWASPIVLAPKKDGSLRFCVDYRKLNVNTVRTAYPMPRVDDTLDSLNEAKYISTLDLRSGYWQVEIDPNSRSKTAFITHRGLYEFLVMPFGLSNAPATFQRLMDVVLAGIKWQSCLVYIDDIVVFSPTFEQHLQDLSAVFDRLSAAGLTLKASKCDFCRKELKYLGHIITPNGIKPDPGLVDSVKCFPQPQKVKDIQAFLGLTGYYRKFIKSYAKIAEPLLSQVRSHQKSKRSTTSIQWSPECTKAFETLKNALTEAPVLRAPNFNEPFIIELDACDYGLGAILTQEYDDRKFVIAYASRTQTAAERNYFPTEKEALAIFWATKHFRPYLEGSTIYIRSDCRALQWLIDTKDLSGRLARWAISLSAFNIVDIKYKPGKTNTNSDTLSRYPLPNLASLATSNQPPTVNLWENCTLLENIKTEQFKDPPQYAQENPQSWDKHLSKLALSIRTSVNETTGDTPAFLNFGRDPKLPIDLLLSTPTQNKPLMPTSLSNETEQYKKHLRQQLSTAHLIANEHNEVRKIQQKERYDQHTAKRSFEEGQLVWVAIPSVLKHGKLDPRYQGPCRIMKVLSPSSFIVHRLSDGVNLGVTNIDRLKPFYEPKIPHSNFQENNVNLSSNITPQPLMNVVIPIHSSSLSNRRPIRTRKQPDRLNL
ncbi:unnamed protein product [Adineta steineri]|uniref:Reverse transcriptase domain-containing protein n=1 Tax=Adineta steineri TaxID=433720 RepID=A0A813VR59_9BILA|nr:unnamed protein product [Adineta steineri]